MMKAAEQKEKKKVLKKTVKAIHKCIIIEFKINLKKISMLFHILRLH